MTCNSAIYTVNQANQSITTTNSQYVTVSLGAIIRRFGRYLGLNGNAIQIGGRGYYKCDCSLTVSPTAAGPISAQLYLNGQPIPGAIATGSVSTEENPLNLTIPPIFRVTCCEGGTLEVKVNASCTINNAALSVVKI